MDGTILEEFLRHLTKAKDDGIRVEEKADGIYFTAAETSESARYLNVCITFKNADDTQTNYYDVRIIRHLKVEDDHAIFLYAFAHSEDCDEEDQYDKNYVCIDGNSIVSMEIHVFDLCEEEDLEDE